MNDYNFEYESLNDRIRDLETEVERLKYENIETTNTLYELMHTLDKIENKEYDLHNFTLGE